MLSGRSSSYARILFLKVSVTPLDKSVSCDIVSCRAVIRASRGDGFAIRRQYFDTWKTAPFLPHEKAKMPHECPRFHVMSAGSHNRHSLFWVKGLQPNFELNLPGATFHLTSISFFSIPSPGKVFYVIAKMLVFQRLSKTFIIALIFGAEAFLPPFSEKRAVVFSVFSVFCPCHVRKREILTSWLESAKTRSFRRGS